MTISLERIYPNNIHTDDAESQSALQLHLDRYNFASQQLTGKIVLDIACGCGYGTAMMAEMHPDKEFTGVDIDPSAIKYAEQHYNLPNLNYVCSSAEKFSAEHSFDTIISLETIEHLEYPENFIDIIINKLLASNGSVIASVPVTPTKDGNPHHLHDFTEQSFLTMFRNHHYTNKESFEQVQDWFVEKNKNKKKSDHSDTGKTKFRMVIKNILHHYIKHPSDLFNRCVSILKHGFCNKYLTVRFTKSSK